ncbi:hypothetical protein K435DRAFT_853592 [Dendrothele bispora CBS 962.96]|uniref:Uncharacterized protein n=1 Tax=Dendrothele bispora (strain CBS 962.96) TaxID=1314807 RepID=A0A4S8MFZ4_DENBC|nr:hypothetical protein K435DRAFT_853592 [Dendrothele bispora CBS 962.96]
MGGQNNKTDMGLPVGYPFLDARSTTKTEVASVITSSTIRQLSTSTTPTQHPLPLSHYNIATSSFEDVFITDRQISASTTRRVKAIDETRKDASPTEHPTPRLDLPGPPAELHYVAGTLGAVSGSITTERNGCSTFGDTSAGRTTNGNGERGVYVSSLDANEWYNNTVSFSSICLPY